jgi:hypothetical protein
MHFLNNLPTKRSNCVHFFKETDINLRCICIRPLGKTRAFFLRPPEAIKPKCAAVLCSCLNEFFARRFIATNSAGGVLWPLVNSHNTQILRKKMGGFWSAFKCPCFVVVKRQLSFFEFGRCATKFNKQLWSFVFFCARVWIISFRTRLMDFGILRKRLLGVSYVISQN